MSTAVAMPRCQHCGDTQHSGMCPKVRAVEYHPDGSIRRVEYHDFGVVRRPAHNVWGQRSLPDSAPWPTPSPGVVRDMDQT